MCGRISQYRLPMHYAQRMHLKNPFVLVDAADRRPGYNLSPGTHPLAIYPDETIRAVHWGYCPQWAIQKKLPQTINARVETASTSAYFRVLWRKARILVPADGWFEWKSEAQARRRETAQAALFHSPRGRRADVPRRADEHPDRGRRARAGRGIRDRDGRRRRRARRRPRPPAARVRRPLPRAAGSIRRCRRTNSTRSARRAASAASQFVWHRVTSDVNRAINDEPRLIEPLEPSGVTQQLSDRAVRRRSSILIGTRRFLAALSRKSAEQLARGRNGDQHEQHRKGEDQWRIHQAFPVAWSSAVECMTSKVIKMRPNAK